MNKSNYRRRVKCIDCRKIILDWSIRCVTCNKRLKQSPETIAKRVPFVIGEKNRNWKGAKVKYSGIHMYIRNKLGAPKLCKLCGRNNKKRMYHWANISHEYKRDLTDWIRLCVPCHSAFDKGKIQLSKE